METRRMRWRAADIARQASLVCNSACCHPRV
uniref:Uncharacterized protein n=1 Tax=Setaria viridis TaxID=4556 RepID=A0A4U6VRJ6_SETVI|nr:hypothetical protein SEVIR_2G111450v2 [Setaria viridis]